VREGFDERAGVQRRVGFLARELKKLAVPVAVVASVWPATMAVQAATSGSVDSQRAATAIGRVRPAASLAALEASQSALATEAEAEIGDEPIADIADRATRLADAAKAWHHGHPGSGGAIAGAMSSLDGAIAALALSPSPGARVAFEQSLAAYRDSIAPGQLI
jgi:hypothetical protein